MCFNCDFVVKTRFGNASVKRIIDWMRRSDLVSTDSCILDVGCGNGVTLVKLVSKNCTY